MTVTISAATHKGLLRSNNEDAVAFFDQILARSDPSPIVATREFQNRPVLCILADGLGGHEGGEIASEFAVRSLIEQENAIADYLDLLKAIDYIHREICWKNSGMPIPKAMGTTICGVLMEGAQGTWFNVGDSRVYRLGKSMLEQLSIDDVPFSESEKRTSSRITQCLGGSSRAIPIDVHHGEFAIDGDDRLLLASDGLTDFVDSDEIIEVCADGDGYSNVARLLDLALKTGGEDNISIAILELT